MAAESIRFLRSWLSTGSQLSPLEAVTKSHCSFKPLTSPFPCMKLSNMWMCAIRSQISQLWNNAVRNLHKKSWKLIKTHSKKGKEWTQIACYYSVPLLITFLTFAVEHMNWFSQGIGRVSALLRFWCLYFILENIQTPAQEIQFEGTTVLLMTHTPPSSTTSWYWGIYANRVLGIVPDSQRPLR